MSTYVKYQTKMFVFKGKCGTGTTDTEDGIKRGLPDASPESIVLGRMKTFAKDMLKLNEDSGDKEKDDAGKKEEEHLDITPDPAPSNYNKDIKI